MLVNSLLPNPGIEPRSPALQAGSLPSEPPGKPQLLSEVTQSCSTLCDPMDCSPPGSSIYGIFQARVLEWVVISFSIFLAFHYRLFLTPFIYKGASYTC